MSLSKGDGSFITELHRAGYGAQPLALGDVNQDGKLDIITANTSSYANVPVTVSVLFGRGDGAFAPGIDYPADAASLALGAVNGDGKLDVVTATSSRSLEILFGACR